DVDIRLVGPSEGSHIAGLLEQRGEGLFDIAIEVDNVAAAVDDLRAKGIDVSDPRIGDGGRQEAMVDPASSHGVPIRLVEKH
ncbi:MAG TPA: VOC family protein, partial [Dehalococcoidia bacterium]